MSAQPSLQEALERAVREHCEGRFGEAERLYRLIISAHPMAVAAVANLAMLLQRLGRFAEAEELWRAVVQLDGQNPQAHERLGTVLGMQGKLSDAIECLKRAV